MIFYLGVIILDNFLMSFNLVFPMFLLLAIGMTARKTGILDEKTASKVNAFVFKALLPTGIFKNVYNSSFDEVFDKKLIAFGVFGVLSCFLILTVLVSVFCKNKESRGVLIQGIYRSNFLIFGLPIAQSFYPDGSLNGKASVLIAIIIPIFNVLAVFALEMFKEEKKGALKTFSAIIKNPLIIGSVLGFVALFFKERGIFIPEALYKIVSDIASAATPMALIVLGASLKFSHLKEKRAYLIWGILGKLIISPLFYITAAVLLGFRDRELAVILAMFISPTAVSSYTMAEQMGADDALAGQLVAVGTVISLFTVFLWVSAMSGLKLIN